MITVVCAAIVVVFFALVLVAVGHAVGHHAKALECSRKEARQEVWDLIESTIKKGEDPAVNGFTMVHAIDNLIVARIKLAKLNGEA